MSIMADKLAVQVPLNSKTLLIISKISFFIIFKKKENNRIFLLKTVAGCWNCQAEEIWPTISLSHIRGLSQTAKLNNAGSLYTLVTTPLKRLHIILGMGAKKNFPTL